MYEILIIVEKHSHCVRSTELKLSSLKRFFIRAESVIRLAHSRFIRLLFTLKEKHHAKKFNN